MSYAEHVAGHRRLAILRHLEGSPEYVSNASILQGVLIGLGLPCTSDQLSADLAWLREQGLARFDPAAEFIVVTATARGTEVARGLAQHPGVQRPRPRV
ncbi:hypothetical protein [Paracoccus sanguinis]|uniref:ArsR family transcriptional regulator n=1 Tax=Paracoccus sanguinis TaxID=1545044 RepID=A0A099G7K8_9RHOB|nr:hypothetical protein [Paracoccus sanguinis]KGJ18710.1 hypothetical protein IX57_03020 [Paracoccus sanguinis]KGJ23266.1 hypothetical protein IX56_03120 [Paracoccus sanguinis]SDX43632.1 hypothetical protein SAMN05444276_106104 [Paracoccus sanguinis]